MWNFLKAAFWFSPRIWGLGSIPINVIPLIGFAVLGFGHPGFWLLGLGLEATYLFGLAANPGFQRWVRLQEQQFQHGGEEDEWQALVRYVSGEARERLQNLEAKCKRIIEMQIVARADQSVLAANRLALKDLMLVYVKLLVAERNLRNPESGRSEPAIRAAIESLEAELSANTMAQSVRESKRATLDILQKRLRNIERRDQYLEEIQSNLQRIEAQIDLAVDEAEMQGRPQFIATDIEVAGSLLSDIFYGDPEAALAELETAPAGKESAAPMPRIKQ